MAVLVGKPAPSFTTAAVLGCNTINDSFTLADYIKGKYAVVFFYPLDFTFVCPSELIAFDHRLEEFKSRGVEVIGVSIDSHFTHLAWKNTPINQGGIGKVGYPLIADMTIARLMMSSMKSVLLIAVPSSSTRLASSATKWSTICHWVVTLMKCCA